MSEGVARFAGVVGHQRVLLFLEQEVASPAHAYLLVGASGVGKATVARLFAAALLCPTGGRHAGECSSCRRVAEGTHPDLMLVDPEGRQSLGVDQARTTVAQAVLTPVEASRKIFLFEDAGSMTEQAANALLKTLEEPTPTTIFLLAVEAEDLLPSTVASRCRSVHFGRVDEAVIRDALIESGVSPDQAEGAAGVAGGRPGLAFNLATRPEVAEFRKAWLGVPLRVSARPGEAFVLAEQMIAVSQPLLAGLRSRLEAEQTRPSAGGGTTLKERLERDVKRASQSLLATGLEILASWYLDAASAHHGGPVRNREVPVAALMTVPAPRSVRNAERALGSVVDLESNLRPQLVLADLFMALAAE